MEGDVEMRVRRNQLQNSDKLSICYLQNDEENKQNHWVRITSNDGYSFIVRRKVAITSGTLKNMLDSDSKSMTLHDTTPSLMRDSLQAVLQKLYQTLVLF